MDIKGKVIVVTGAASGIGRALCERFVRESASAVVVSDIDSVGMAETVALLGDDSEVMGVPCDVGNEESVNRLVQEVLKRFKKIDLFCANAGIFTAGGEEVSIEAWQKIWDVNVMSHVCLLYTSDAADE